MERSNYARLEARGNKLSVEQLEQIARVLGVSVVELLTGEVQKVEDSESVKVLEKEVKRLEESLKEVREFNKNLGSINQSYRRSIKTSKEELDEYKGTTLIDVERIIQEAIDDPKIDSKELSDMVKNLF